MKLSKEEKSWCLYDWASCAYAMIIMTAVFPLCFKQVATNAGIAASTSTAYFGYANSIASILLFVIAPIFGTIADYKGLKKKLFAFFAFLGIGFTLLLSVVPKEAWWLLLVVYIITSVGYAGANIFYDSFLTDITKKKDMDRVSTWGFASGYIGNLIPFIISMALIIMAQNNIIPIDVNVAMRIAFVIAALWWGLFTIPMLKNVHQKYSIPHVKNPVASSFKSLWHTCKNVVHYKEIFIFLLAYFFYIDGVSTIIKMATSYGSDIGVSNTMLMLALLATQFVAFPCAILYGKLADKFGTKKMILVAICIYTLVCVYALFLKTTVDFWILAIAVGTSQGGIQALSRSYFGKIIPKEKSNHFFGFYNVFGRFSAIAGPLLLGITTQLTGNSRYGVFSLIILFVVGGLIFLRCKKLNVE